LITAWQAGCCINNPEGLTRGPDGALWFANFYGVTDANNSIGRITHDGATTTFKDGTIQPYGVALGPDGAIWFTNPLKHSIGRITTAGVITTFTDPAVDSSTFDPQEITAGPDGALWFTTFAADTNNDFPTGEMSAIGRITTGGAISLYPFDNGFYAPRGITVGPDGALWFTTRYALIGRITTAGSLTFFDGIAASSIAAAPDGALWLWNGNVVGRMTTSGALTTYQVVSGCGAGCGNPGITVGPDGALWFTKPTDGSIGRITTDGVVTSYPTFSSSFPQGIAMGPDGNLWYTDIERNSVGRITTGETNAGVLTAVGSQAGAEITGAVVAGARNFNVDAHHSPSVTPFPDAFCGYMSFNSLPQAGTAPPPNGASGGLDALRQSVAGTYPDIPSGTGRGCIDIVRSDRPPRPTGSSGDNASFEYYDYALDAVTWASPSLRAPATMTLTQLRSVWNCTLTDWSQVGGASGPIERFLPPAGSGTRDVFISNVLGFDPTSFSNANCPQVVQDVAENTGTDLLNSSDAAGFQEAVLPYSGGAFVSQANNSTNPTLDVRGGVRPGGLTQSGTPVYAIRWTGSAWLLNNTTIVGGRTVHDATTSGGTGSPPPSPIVTSAQANFTSGDVDATVAGTNIPPGATITSVDSASQVHISIPTLASATGGDLTIGSAAVSETNPNLTNPADAGVYPGVRFLSNVIDTTEPSYAPARALIGYDVTRGGTTTSLLCNGAFATTIRSAGYLDLPYRQQSNGITTTCRYQTP
jgi:streptogramin lyase